MVSVMPSAVSGLTKQEAPSAGVVPSGSGRHSRTFNVRYCVYIAPPIIATVLPINAFAASDEPVLITTPAPSLPTGMDSSSRPAIARIAPSGTFAVMTGAPLSPEAFAVLISAAPIRSPRWDGLIGAASTRTTTSSAAGSGVGTSSSEISSSPLFLISERSCRPFLPSLMSILPCLCPSAGLCQRLQCRLAAVERLLSELLLDAQELVVFGGAIGARKGASLDLTAIGGNREVGDGGILGLAGAVRHHRGVAGLVRHLDGGERLGQRADLVDLDQDRVGPSGLDAFGEALDVGDKEIVADELALLADEVGQLLPAVHVVFRHAVLDGDDRIARDEISKVLGLLGDRAGLALALIYVLAVLEELGRGAVEANDDVGARLVAGLADRVHDEFERGVRRRQVRGKAALVADICVEASLPQIRLQGVQDLRPIAQALGKGGRANRQDHEFLEVDRIVGVHAAIDDVHHRHRQETRGGAADVTVQRHVERVRGRLGAGERHAEDGGGAQPALVRRAVEVDHDLVELGLLLDIEAAQRLEDLAVDGADCLGDALAEIAGLVAVAQFHRLMGAGGGARRHGSTAERTIFQHDVDLDGGIATAIENFAADDVDDGGHDVHFRSLGLIGAAGLTRTASKCERLEGGLRLTREAARTKVDRIWSAAKPQSETVWVT